MKLNSSIYVENNKIKFYDDALNNHKLNSINKHFEFKKNSDNTKCMIAFKRAGKEKKWFTIDTATKIKGSTIAISPADNNDHNGLEFRDLTFYPNTGWLCRESIAGIDLVHYIHNPKEKWLLVSDRQIAQRLGLETGTHYLMKKINNEGVITAVKDGIKYEIDLSLASNPNPTLPLYNNSQSKKIEKNTIQSAIIKKEVEIATKNAIQAINAMQKLKVAIKATIAANKLSNIKDKQPKQTPNKKDDLLTSSQKFSEAIEAGKGALKKSSIEPRKVEKTADPITERRKRIGSMGSSTSESSSMSNTSDKENKNTQKPSFQEGIIKPLTDLMLNKKEVKTPFIDALTNKLNALTPDQKNHMATKMSKIDWRKFIDTKIKPAFNRYSNNQTEDKLDEPIKQIIADMTARKFILATNASTNKAPATTQQKTAAKLQEELIKNVDVLKQHFSRCTENQHVDNVAAGVIQIANALCNKTNIEMLASIQACEKKYTANKQKNADDWSDDENINDYKAALKVLLDNIDKLIKPKQQTLSFKM